MRQATPDLLAQTPPSSAFDLVGVMRSPEPETPEGSALAKLSAATRALAQARTLPEVKQIIDIAEAARAYARAARLGTEAANHAAEIKILAQHRAGEMLAELERAQTAGLKRGPLSQAVTTGEYAAVLAENEINRMTAHRWQKLAEVPVDMVRECIGSVMQEERELTAAALMRQVQERRRQERQQPPVVAPEPEPYRVEAILVGGGARRLIGVIHGLADAVAEKLADGRLRVELVLVQDERGAPDGASEDAGD